MTSRGSGLYTQCPDCGTVFRVTATVLRAAHGQVRCGVCDATFDAIAFLTENVEAVEPVEPAAAPASVPPSDARADSAVASEAALPQEHALDEIAARIARAAAADVASLEVGATVMFPAAVTAAAAETPTGLAASAEAEPHRGTGWSQADEPPAATEQAVTAASSPEADAPVAAESSVAAQSPRTAASHPEAEEPVDAGSPPAADRSFEAEAYFEAESFLDTDTSIEVDLPLAAEAPTAAAMPPDAAAASATAIGAGSEASSTAAAGDAALADGLAAEDDIPDSALEFNAPVEDWDRVFVTDQSAVTAAPLHIELSAVRYAALQGGEDADDPPARTDEYAMLDFDAEPPADLPATATATADRLRPSDAAGDKLATARLALADRPERRPAAGPNFEPDSATRAATGRAAAARSRRPPAALAASAVLLMLALGAQAVHYWRDSLAGQPVIGAPLARLYERLGQPLEPRWIVTAYDVKQWGAATDARPGALRVRASIVNRAAYAQPYPLLRVSFEDRFGGRIARRDFNPAEYLPGRAPPSQLLPAGARADADLSIVDPSAQAVGFELDVCLARRGVLTCSSNLKLAGGGP